jgi:hypothetical protein
MLWVRHHDEVPMAADMRFEEEYMEQRVNEHSLPGYPSADSSHYDREASAGGAFERPPVNGMTGTARTDRT